MNDSIGLEEIFIILTYSKIIHFKKKSFIYLFYIIKIKKKNYRIGLVRP